MDLPIGPSCHCRFPAIGKFSMRKRAVASPDVRALLRKLVSATGHSDPSMPLRIPIGADVLAAVTPGKAISRGAPYLRVTWTFVEDGTSRQTGTNGRSGTT